MDNKTKPTDIPFALTGITTEEFAVLEENYSCDLTHVEITTDLEFRMQKENCMLAVFVKNKLVQNGKPFVILKSGCHFIIENSAFQSHYKEETSRFSFPREFMTHLAVLAVGTARGILHTKTENSPYNQFFLPTLNLTEMITVDIEF